MNSLQQLRHRAFARHAHPVSAWSRLLTTPSVVAPPWTRRADVTTGVLVWFAINPLITPEPTDRTSLATRAVLGEERWVADPDLDRTILVLNALGFAPERRHPGRLASTKDPYRARHSRLNGAHTMLLGALRRSL